MPSSFKLHCAYDTNISAETLELGVSLQSIDVSKITNIQRTMYLLALFQILLHNAAIFVLIPSSDVLHLLSAAFPSVAAFYQKVFIMLESPGLKLMTSLPSFFKRVLPQRHIYFFGLIKH